MPSYQVSGVTIRSEFAFSWPLRPGGGEAHLSFECAGEPPVHVRWADAAVAHEEPAGSGEGASSIRWHPLDGLDVVRIGDIADHYVFPDRIFCHLRDADAVHLVEIQLLGMILALWLERRGTPTLHASTVALGDEGVAFLGEKGRGKTTVGAAMVTAGHAFVADDLLALELGEAEALAHPGYPMLRLWPDQADHFLGHHASFPLVHPRFSKRRVPVGGAGFGAFRAHPVPLRRIFVLAPSPDGRVRVEPLPPRRALMMLVGHSFLRRAVHGLGLAEERIGTLTRLLEGVRVSILRYPAGFDRLPDVVRTVEEESGC